MVPMTNTSVEKVHIWVDKASAAFLAPSYTRFEVTSSLTAPAGPTDVDGVDGNQNARGLTGDFGSSPWSEIPLCALPLAIASPH
jgi:hypothetical protein